MYLTTENTEVTKKNWFSASVCFVSSVVKLLACLAKPDGALLNVGYGFWRLRGSYAAPVRLASPPPRRRLFGRFFSD
jgi:hypothetical protein